MMSEQDKLAGLSYVLTEYDDLLQQGRFSPSGATLLSVRMHTMAAHWADLRGLPWGGADDHDLALADATQYRAAHPDAIAAYIREFDARRAAEKGGHG